ncbi:hypothetical protein SAMN02745218_02617 [Desulfofundulus australicus DSM 11792]|jgi:hypothetical protein|uniref:Antitoxin SocA-like Panacea domain-containing protein n=1 Tax=Desulfofundulus australicus DSM 11792 TaxID=1121425 RepID=A0A1M5CRR9_9FIRM|nr:hypothetical protein [Desulfofundulus australicus]SHF57461.1 hypothetical protein SAMN02745218_02617 [Desulfofundulus australicus DSM 11792]
MTALENFLLMLEAAGGKMAGKTLIQKRAYFLNEFLKLGLRFKPHYYGPYSPDLDDAIGRAKVLGFVQESAVDFGPNISTGFEVRRFDYILTPDGKVVVAALKKQYRSEWEQLAETLSKIYKADKNDYVALSLAAKAFYVLSTLNTPLSVPDIVREARRIGWRVSERDVERAAELLMKLGLVNGESAGVATVIN